MGLKQNKNQMPKNFKAAWTVESLEKVRKLDFQKMVFATFKSEGGPLVPLSLDSNTSEVLSEFRDQDVKKAVFPKIGNLETGVKLFEEIKKFLLSSEGIAVEVIAWLSLGDDNNMKNQLVYLSYCPEDKLGSKARMLSSVARKSIVDDLNPKVFIEVKKDDELEFERLI